MKSSTIAILSIALIVIIVAGYFALTYPRVVFGTSVSFKNVVGAQEKREFNVPFLDSHVQVQVAVSSGGAFWTAQIMSGNQMIWSDTRPEGSRTTYSSDWIELSSGSYNFTFGILLGGFLNASINILSKGGYW